MTVYIREADIDAVAQGMTVTIGDTDYILAELPAKPQTAGEDFDEYTLHVGGIQQGEWLYAAILSGPYAEGIFPADITVDRVSPMSFVVN